MNRRNFIKSVSAAGALGLTSRLAGQIMPPPNVLLILCDQMHQPRWFRGAPMPNLERLAAQGVTFTNHFVSAVPCSPSRACLMTGMNVDQHGILKNVDHSGQSDLDISIPTLGHIMQDAGYLTPYAGKWHLSDRSDLSDYGFSRISGEYKKISGSGLLNDRGHTGATAEWLHGAPSSPWFLTCSLINPHDICAYSKHLDLPSFLVPDLIAIPPDNYDDDLIGKPSIQLKLRKKHEKKLGELRNKKDYLNLINYYYFLCRQVDYNLGRILDALEVSGQAANTLVIFTSDHGSMAGAHGLRSKGPFIYRENLNVPLVVSWPGYTPPGTISDALSQNVDLFPTFCEITGADPGVKPGRSLIQNFQNPGLPGSNYARSHYRTGVHLDSIRTTDYAYGYYADTGEHELYDLVNDPLEMTNVSGDSAYEEIELQLREEL